MTPAHESATPSTLPRQITPVPTLGPAPLRAMLAEARYELIRLMRTRPYALSVIGLPLMLYLVFGLGERSSPAALELIARYSCLGLGSACLFGVGLGIALERADGWLDLKRVSPLPPLAYLIAKVAASVVITLMVMGLLITLGISVGGVTVSLAQAARLALVLLLGAMPFTAAGALIALTVSPRAGAGLINLLYIPLSVASGFWMPVRMLPHWLRAVAPALPTYHLAQLALAVFARAPRAAARTHWLALGAFTVLMFAAAWITFVRSEARST